MSSFHLSRRPSPPTALAYGIAIGAVTAALLFAVLLERYLQSMPTVSLLLCAIMFVAWFGGLRPSLLAAGLTVLYFVYFIVEPGHDFDLGKDLPRIALFVVTASFVVVLCAVQRANSNELARVNKALLAENAERKRVEAYLDEAQALSRTGCFGRKTGSNEVFLSKEGYRVLDIDPGEKKPMLRELARERVHPDDRSILETELDRIPSGEREYDFELRWLTTRSEVRYLHVRAHGATGAADGYEVVGAVMDVTETRQTQEALQATQAALTHSARVASLGEMSASIAHEVNQPLAGIITNGEAALRWLNRKEPQPEEVRDALERMIHDAKRASEVVRHLRALARKGSAEREPLDLKDVIGECVRLLQHEIQRRRVVVEADSAPDLPRVVANRIELQQVIINLMVNGMQAMDLVSERPRHLTVGSTMENDVAVVAVADSGSGLDRAIESRLFSPFFTTREGGMGMGLSICRTIVESHGGRIWASSNQGPGATFRFSLPFEAAMP